MNNECRLKKVLSDLFKIPVESINESTSVDTIEKWDSLNHLNLVIALEMEFNISFTEQQTVEILNYPLMRMVLQEHGVEFNEAE